MTIIADSGATKTLWTALADDGHTATLRTAGISPVHQSDGDIRGIAGQARAWLSTLEPAASLHFYGAGCVGDGRERVVSALAGMAASVSVESDLTGAARALCGHTAGIACILGTGSNSCVYDGRRIVANTPPLGYILGDEGSGAAIGKAFIRAIFKGQLPAALREEFLAAQALTYPTLISRVYRQPQASRFLASAVPFVASHIDVPGVSGLVSDQMLLFIHYNIDPYGRTDLPVHFVGGVAHTFRDTLARVTAECGYTMGAVAQTPVPGLAEYHKRQAAG